MDHLHSYTNVVQDVTFMGLNRWYAHLFKKAGWIFLAKRDGYTDKVQNYLREMDHLLSALDKKMKTIEEKDRRDDLQIIKRNILTLQSTMKNLL